MQNHYLMRRKIIIPTTTAMVIILSLLFVFIQDEASAQKQDYLKCLIIVSGNEGYSEQELSKASSFRDHQLTHCDYNDIRYLTDPSDPNSQGPANLSNVEEGFDWLKTNTSESTEVVVYISDHAQAINNENYFLFDDGNISIDTVDSWLDQVQCNQMTIVLNGERSGLGGPDLSDPGRDVICSMGANQSFSPDLFNITRSLEDPSADTNHDGQVSYIEAYWKEVENLQGTDQDPCIWM